MDFTHDQLGDRTPDLSFSGLGMVWFMRMGQKGVGTVLQ
jgi:hypothetical protein